MNKFITALATGIILLCHGIAYGQINQAEYFYDIDPGVGNGTAIAVSTADSVDITASFPTTGLSAGFHNLCIRTRNAGNRWSLYAVRNFYLQAPSTMAPKIVAAEYFFDSDPGLGNGTPLSTGAVADSVDITSAVTTTGLSTGFHNLFIRTKNSTGLWSLYAPRNFYVQPIVVAANLKVVAAEYFIDTDPGIGNGIEISPSFTTADSVDLNRALSISGLSAGLHRLHIRTRNQDGGWSHAVSDSFIACTGSSGGVAISGTTALCVGVSDTFTNSAGSGTWISVKGHASVNNAGIVTGVTTGIDTIRCTVTTCGTTVAEKVVTVNPTPGSITVKSVVCTGASTTLSNSLAGGTWTSDNPTIASVVAATGIVTGEGAPGTTSITYAMPTGCSKTTVVTVNMSPAAITGSSSVSKGGTVTLASATPGGKWSSGTISSATVGLTNGIVSGVGVGTSRVSYTLGTGCAATTVVSVNAASSAVRLYPNPALGAFTVEASVTGEIVVYSVDGKEIEVYTLKSGVNSIMLPEGTISGTYICRFKGGDGSSQFIKLINEQ